MILAVDVHYNSAGAYVGAALCEFWDSHKQRGFSEHCLGVEEILDYTPGELYKRELPFLLKIIAPLLKTYPIINTIVVDGYVDLGEGVPGLGRHLFHALEEKVEVVGVAKTVYKGAPCVEVLRGTSKKPLLVTSTGDVHKAASGVKSMDGPDRLPYLLMKADHIARGFSNV